MAALDNLPQQLGYLREFLELFLTFHEEELDDADTTLLEDALRNRIAGVDILEAEKILEADKELIERWIREHREIEDRGHWLVGYLASPSHIVDEIRDCEDSNNATNQVAIESPSGWEQQHSELQLQLTNGKLFVVISEVDELVQRMGQVGYRNWTAPKGVAMELLKDDVDFGSVTGTKYSIVQSTPFRSKAIEYLLKAPGGFARVEIRHLELLDFDETILESELHTLRIEQKR